MDSMHLFPDLLKWLCTFDSCHEVSSARQLSDGLIIATVLHTIEPVWFNETWMNKINKDVGDNWRLKVRNLKKIVQAISDYFSDSLEMNTSCLRQPELSKLAEHSDVAETTILLQQVLGVAVNCSRKQEYIGSIQRLQSSVQAALMAAIQQLMTTSLAPSTGHDDGSCWSLVAASGGGGGGGISGVYTELLDELRATREERDSLKQRCLELERQLQSVQEARTVAQQDSQQLQARLSQLQHEHSSAATPETPGGERYQQLRLKLDAAQDEIYRLESCRDELNTKYNHVFKQLKDTQHKNEDLQCLANESRSLKDELDILRETSCKVPQYETTLETYKKRLQEMGDLRRQIAALEAKNCDYAQLNMELEQEVKRAGYYRPQLDICKQRLESVHEQLAEQGERLGRSELDARHLADQLDTVQKERDRVVEDRERLKETLEDMRLSQLAQQNTGVSRVPSSSVDVVDAAGSLVVPTDSFATVPAVRREMLPVRGENSQLSCGNSWHVQDTRLHERGGRSACCVARRGETGCIKHECHWQRRVACECCSCEWSPCMLLPRPPTLPPPCHCRPPQCSSARVPESVSHRPLTRTYSLRLPARRPISATASVNSQSAVVSKCGSAVCGGGVMEPRECCCSSHLSVTGSGVCECGSTSDSCQSLVPADDSTEARVRRCTPSVLTRHGRRLPGVERWPASRRSVQRHDSGVWSPSPPSLGSCVSQTSSGRLMAVSVSVQQQQRREDGGGVVVATASDEDSDSSVALPRLMRCWKLGRVKSLSLRRSKRPSTASSSLTSSSSSSSSSSCSRAANATTLAAVGATLSLCTP